MGSDLSHPSSQDSWLSCVELPSQLCTCFVRLKPDSTATFFEYPTVQSRNLSLPLVLSEEEIDTETTRRSTPKKISKLVSRGNIKDPEFLSSNETSSKSCSENLTSDSDVEYKDVLRHFVKRQRSMFQVNAEFLSQWTATPIPVSLRVASLGYSFSWHQVDPRTGRIYRKPLGSIRFSQLLRASAHIKNPSIVELVIQQRKGRSIPIKATVWLKFQNPTVRKKWENALIAIWRNVNKHGFQL